MLGDGVASTDHPGNCGVLFCVLMDCPLMSPPCLIHQNLLKIGIHAADIPLYLLDLHFLALFTNHIQIQLKFSIRSEEHTSELQSRENLVCRLLLEKKKTNKNTINK